MVRNHSNVFYAIIQQMWVAILNNTSGLIQVKNLMSVTFVRCHSVNNAVLGVLEKCKVTPVVVGMTFNTTANNTGRWKGASNATAIEKSSRCSKFYFGCHHHINDLQVKHSAKKAFYEN